MYQESHNQDEQMTLEKEFHGPNLGYIMDLYEQYRNDPDAVDEPTRTYFEKREPQGFSGVDLQALVGTINLAQAIRSYGYLAAQLDPLGGTSMEDPLLTLEFHHLQEEDLKGLPASIVGVAGEAGNAGEAIQTLRSIYQHKIGYDYGHIRSHQEREWLRQAAESGQFRPPQLPLDENKLLERLTQVEAFEIFLHRLFPGKTRFSIEGVDLLIPMLDEIIGAAARDTIRTIMMGMAHRGRLNVLAHILHRPYDQILAEFRDPKGRATTWDELGWTGDVKYHMGGSKSLTENKETGLVVRMPANPSHLEHIDPVIEGMARAANTKADQAGAPQYFENASLPVLIHGDAAFPGQGVVAETLNMSRLRGYSTGGSLHIITNNQLGFTAADNESRSSTHASDLAKGFEIPIIHVNADDPRACIEAARTAFAYRQKFHKDFVINLIGYRRHGHNEGDEPRFTQPLMYQKVDKHPTVRQLWAAALETQGQLEAGRAEVLLQTELQHLQDVNDKLDEEEALNELRPTPPPRGAAQKIKTSVPLKRLKELNQSLVEIPENFHLNSKLIKSIEKRRKLLEQTKDVIIDWATSEELAFASILEEGIPIRLTGQDTIRGTFSQRHASFYDVETNQTYTPMQSIPQGKASLEVLNSPLSEAGAIGFEVGYNLQAPDRLVVWEAQYGDFINNAQSVIDEMLLSGRAKWGLTPSLVLLLPHGNEGQGPDHSSARMERFLELAAETNVRIAFPSTASQYFHLLRRQALLLKTDPLPLIVFTHKGLLRHPMIASPLNLFTEGSWQAVIDDIDLPGRKKEVKNLLLCSGRIYVDLMTSSLRKENADDAIARVEQLYPFPKEELKELIAGYPSLERVIWVQEEPNNMGAWHFVRNRLRELMGEKLSLHYVGRPKSSSPAEGSTTAYRINQQELIQQAFKFEKQTSIRSVIKERG
jgi:2-oxoglutarate dehydrogenase E1 component